MVEGKNLLTFGIRFLRYP